MGVIRDLLFVTMILAGIMVFLTYTPSDSRYFWTYWFLVFTFLFFGYLLDKLFCSDLVFVFDPNPENWRRKTDPQS
eukprot:scaffold167_cov168-Ochromonas_danica.AAC.18